MTWSVEREARAWQETFRNAHDGNVFQSAGWGQHKQRSGWRPERWIARDHNGDIAMMAQVLVRSIPGATIAWAPGGPLFRFSPDSERFIARNLQLLLRELAHRHPRLYIRFDSYVPHDERVAFAFAQSCLRPVATINSGYTTIVDLDRPVEALLRGMAKNHRYEVRRAIEHDLTWRASSGPAAVGDLVALYNEMIEWKKVPLRPFVADDLASLCSAMGGNAVVFSGARGARVLTSCLVLLCARTAFYFAAATSPLGRDVGAAYAMIYRLLEYLRQEGITSFDFGGLDPQPQAAGVNHFKRGFGGSLVEYVGEWEWARLSWMRWAVNLAIPRRRTRFMRIDELAAETL